MKMTKGQLLSSDWNTLFTRDPGTFFEAVLINILWDNRAPGGNIDQELVARQRFVFERWHKYFAANLRHDIEIELGLLKSKATADYQNGHIAGQISALTNLPMKSGAFGKSVDLNKVAAELKRLKAVEPIGVSNHEAQTVS
jgi:hypothetical protein